MAKLQDILGLAEFEAKVAASSPQDWMRYLDTASRLYRYPFSDTLLIHAQRRDATACAELEVWNEKMMRWVNRGAKGIALIDDTGPRRREMDADTAFTVVQDELDTLIEQNFQNGDASVFVDAYRNWENFREWIAEDVFQRTYQDYLVDNRDAIELHGDDPVVPQWLKGMVVEAERQEIRPLAKLIQENAEEREPELPQEKPDSAHYEEIDGQVSEAVEVSGTAFDEYSPEQMDVIYAAAEAGVELAPLLHPEFPPEQMQLIADVLESMAAENKVSFDKEINPLTSHR